jgi:hypothetical protein
MSGGRSERQKQKRKERLEGGKFFANGSEGRVYIEYWECKDSGRQHQILVWAADPEGGAN